jgi:hypothetical protein
MSKEKVTLTLDVDNLAELRSMVGAKSLSSTVDAAIIAELSRRRHLAAIDGWLAELDEKHGRAPHETLVWAKQVVDGWAGRRTRRRKAG